MLTEAQKNAIFAATMALECLEKDVSARFDALAARVSDEITRNLHACWSQKELREVSPSISDEDGAYKAHEAWMIEWPHGEGRLTAQWWTGRRANETEMVWTDDSHAAVQFVRKEDAENTLRFYRYYVEKASNGRWTIPAEIEVTGHMFMAGPPPLEARASREAVPRITNQMVDDALDAYDEEVMGEAWGGPAEGLREPHERNGMFAALQKALGGPFAPVPNPPAMTEGDKRAWDADAEASRALKEREAVPSDSLIERMVTILEARYTPRPDYPVEDFVREGYLSFLRETARGLFDVATGVSP